MHEERVKLNYLLDARGLPPFAVFTILQNYGLFHLNQLTYYLFLQEEGPISL